MYPFYTKSFICPHLSAFFLTPSRVIYGSSLNLFRGHMYRVVQLNFTQEIEVFYVLFNRSLPIFNTTYLKQQMEYFNFRWYIQLDLPVQLDYEFFGDMPGERARRRGSGCSLIGCVAWSRAPRRSGLVAHEEGDRTGALYVQVQHHRGVRVVCKVECVPLSNSGKSYKIYGVLRYLL